MARCRVPWLAREPPCRMQRGAARRIDHRAGAQRAAPPRGGGALAARPGLPPARTGADRRSQHRRDAADPRATRGRATAPAMRDGAGVAARLARQEPRELARCAGREWRTAAVHRRRRGDGARRGGSRRGLSRARRAGTTSRSRPASSCRARILSQFTLYFGVLFSMYSRPWSARDPRSRAHVGIGAFNLVRRDAYLACGGHERIRLRPDDDMKLGKLLKLGGFRQDFLNGNGAVEVEWYWELARGARRLDEESVRRQRLQRRGHDRGQSRATRAAGRARARPALRRRGGAHAESRELRACCSRSARCARRSSARGAGAACCCRPLRCSARG